MAAHNPFDDAHRLRDPFSDSMARLPPGQDIEKEMRPHQRSFIEPEERPTLFSRIIRRGWLIGILVLVLLGLCVVLPVAIHVTKSSAKADASNAGSSGGASGSSGGLTGSLANLTMPSLIDPDTPEDARTSTALSDGSKYVLVFSDEFNSDGRSFYPGDDPYWEAADLHYWQTNNLEWYDPSAITTKNGALEITLTKTPNHGLDYMGGMMSTWNKFCFTGGRIEASVSLPGANNVMGLWPAVWAMGNLGRAGYGASLEGMWPYTYDACDVGTLPNQTQNSLPAAAVTGGDPSQNGVLSFLPGQRLSRCTCNGEDHPGPKHTDGTFVGRSAPEIDAFEATVSDVGGQVSQSGQWAPFNAGYNWLNTTDNFVIPNTTMTQLNAYKGGVFQQATSAISTTDHNCYELGTKCFSTYGFEYKPGFDDAYITWISNNQLAWTLKSSGMAADSNVEISARPIPQEPMYLIMNLGISPSFGFVDVDHLTFPTTMRVDWVRVYQPADKVNVGCDPKDFPTASYINKHLEAYTNANLTTWVDDFKQTFPKNKLIDTC